DFAALDLEPDVSEAVGDLRVRQLRLDELAQPVQRGFHSCSRKRTSFSNKSRRSSMPWRSMAIRSMPVPNAYPVYCSGSYPHIVRTSGFTMPAPRISIQPVNLQMRQPFPPHGGCEMPTSADGS